MEHRIHFAGINTPGLAEAAKGQDVLVSYADVKRRKNLWAWLRPLIASGHFRSVILDSGAFTELSFRKRGREFKVTVQEFAAFAAEHQELFAWVANLDDIEGDVARSNANYEALRAAGVKNLVPVWHEGESDAQLEHCIALARESVGILAVGAQRPKGKLVPANVVKFLGELFPKLPKDIAVHGFGLTRYASTACPGGKGFPFTSTDSTTWIAEACCVERSGAYKPEPDETRSGARAKAFVATVASYASIEFVVGPARMGFAELAVPAGFDYAAAMEYGHQARTVARRITTGG